MNLKPARKKVFALVLVGILLIFSYIFLISKPSNNRNWTQPFAIAPQVKIKNNIVSIKNVRDFRFDSDKLVTKRYTDRDLDVNQISKVWFLVEPFGDSEFVAHTYFVFDFNNAPPIAVSVEARRTTEEYSALIGMFNQYELIYLWTTEEDQTIKRVVNYKDRVYMYPLLVSIESAQKLLLQLAQQTAELENHPRFYNTLLNNCTNELAKVANQVKLGTIPFHYALFLTGYSSNLLYDLNLIPNDKSLNEIKKQYYINDKVNNLYRNPDFSNKLREELNSNAQ